jgi:hypothetical protein
VDTCAAGHKDAPHIQRTQLTTEGLNQADIYVVFKLGGNAGDFTIRHTEELISRDFERFLTPVGLEPTTKCLKGTCSAN